MDYIAIGSIKALTKLRFNQTENAQLTENNEFHTFKNVLNFTSKVAHT